MPIIIDDFKWLQTDSIVTITIPLKNFHPKHVDVEILDRYVKLSFCPYFFEKLLYKEIDQNQSRCTFANGNAIFELMKIAEANWPELEWPLSREEKRIMQKMLLEEGHKQYQEKCKEMRERKAELKRVCVRNAIAQDTKERKYLEDLKSNIKNKALGDIKSWHNNLQNTPNFEDSSEEEEVCEPEAEALPKALLTHDSKKISTQQVEAVSLQKSREITEKAELISIYDSKEVRTEKAKANSIQKCTDISIQKPKAMCNQQPKALCNQQLKTITNQKPKTFQNSKVTPIQKAKPSIPSIRNQQTVEVTFTERAFPTPCRESRMEEENEWLRKQVEARRSVGFDQDDLRPEEKNPQYLKFRGDEFMKKQNYLGAVSAYSFGIKLSEKYSDLYIARSEAQLALGNFNNCAQDCSKAIELMKPEVPANLQQRITCISRRGIALFKLGMHERGVNEIRAALRLQPDSEEMKKLLADTQEEWENCDSDS